MSGVKTQRLADGGTLAYAVTGPETAESILLLRPLGGTMALWGTFATTLAETYRVLAFDPRGVGASSDVPWFHSTRDMARDAKELLDALGVSKTHVFGLSLGGMVASWLAIDAPKRVNRLILAGTLPRATAVSRRVFEHTVDYLRGFASPGAEAEVNLVNEILSEPFRRSHPDRVRAIDEAVRRSPAKRRNLGLLALAAATHSAEYHLHAVESETLLLVGELDPIALGGAQRELVEDLAHVRRERIPRAGHDITLEKPEEVARRVLRFLSEGHPPTKEPLRFV